MKKQLLLLLAATLIILPGFAQTLQDAIKLTQSERYESASDAFKVLVKTDAKGDAYFYYADNFMRWEELDSAKIILAQGSQTFPGNPLIQAGLGKVALLENKSAEASPRFNKAIEILKTEAKTLSKDYQATVYNRMAEGYIYAESKNPDQALAYLLEAEKLNPKDAEIYILRGNALLAKNTGDASDAIANFTKAFEMDKSSRRAILGQANLYRQVKNFDEALVFYAQAINLDPGFAPAYRERAELYYQAGKYTKGLEDYKKYLELNNSPSARSRYILNLYLLKDYENAIKEANILISQGYNNPLLYRVLAYSYYETKKFPEGLQSMEKFREMAKGGTPKVINNDYKYYGKLLAASGKDSLGILELQKAIELDPAFVDGYGEIGAIYFKQKKYPEAASYYRVKIAKVEKADFNDYNYLGRALYQSKDYVGADSAFNKVIEFLPNLTIGYFWSARSKNMQDNPTAPTGLAKPMFEKVIELGSADVEKNKKDLITSYEYLGYYYFTKKEYACAKAAFTKLKEIDPANEKVVSAFNDKNINGATASCELLKVEQPK